MSKDPNNHGKLGKSYGKRESKDIYICNSSFTMTIFDTMNDLGAHVAELSSAYKMFYDRLRKLEGKNYFNLVFQKSETYLKNGSDRVERMKRLYDEFSSQLGGFCDKYVDEVNHIEEEEKNEVEELKNEFEKIKEEMKENNEELNKESSFYEVREPVFIFREDIKSKINVDLVKKYPGSYLYREYMNGERTKDGDVFLDLDCKNEEFILKYMNDDDSLFDDIKKMDTEKKKRLLNDLDFLGLPIKKDIVLVLSRNEDNEMMEAWKERRIVNVPNRNACNLYEYSLWTTVIK